MAGQNAITTEANGASALLTYAAERQVGRRMRALFIIACGGIIMAAIAPRVGLAVALFGFAAEAVEALVLRAITAQEPMDGEATRRWQVAGVAAAVHGFSIAAALALLWSFGAPDPAAYFLVIAFSTAVALDSGGLLSTVPRITLLRIVPLVAAITSLWLIDIVRGADRSLLMIVAITGLMIGVPIALHLRAVSRRAQESVLSREDLIRSKQELENAYEELRAEQDEVVKLSLVARHASDAVTISDAAGRVQWVNRAFSLLTGYSGAEAVGKTRAELLYGADTSESSIRAIEEAVSWAQSLRTEVCAYSKDRTPLWIETSLVPLPGRNGQTDLIICIDRDISVERRDSVVLQEVLDAAVDSGEAHAVLLEFLETEVACALDTGTPEASALGARVAALITLSREDPSLIVQHRSAFGLDACLTETIRKLRPTARRKGLFLDLDFVADAGLRVEGPADRVGEIVESLLRRAIRVTSGGGVVLRVRHEKTRQGHDVTLEIKTTAPRKGEAGAPLEGDGTRIPLSLDVCADLALLMGGALETGDDPSTGGWSARFRFACADPEDTETEIAGLPALDGCTVLLAENRPHIRTCYERLLEKTGARIRMAGSARDLREALELDVPDLLLHSEHLPGGAVADILECYTRVPAICIAPEGRAKPGMLAFPPTADQLFTAIAKRLDLPRDAA
ncbi:PAS domain S-box-containing protein [Poseidonocella pacifica]|uniref:PAS domain S-box-containing protein n=1 Tax=Poseidonocella pacifica TaxID=871651 RepID=A0A1I0XBQ1_9RHOB|nr:PAS domain-containing protein [Poseidonocella pacifica]SFA98304.1 PAS domain S-box-containing protein [Poseidonocella pacifica]